MNPGNGRLAAGLIALLLAGLTCGCHAVQFTDVFSTVPDAPDRLPFTWDALPAGVQGSVWKMADGALEYGSVDASPAMGSVLLQTAGLALRDDSAFSLEVGFRHLEGTTPRAAYETLFYVTWQSDTTGQMRDPGCDV